MGQQTGGRIDCMTTRPAVRRDPELFFPMQDQVRRQEVIPADVRRCPLGLVRARGCSPMPESISSCGELTVPTLRITSPEAVTRWVLRAAGPRP
jgi:hypothetical protein